MSNILHKVKDALTSDHGDKHSSTHPDSTQSSNYGSQNQSSGYGSQNQSSGYGSQNQPSNYGSHDSNIANAADRRVDSDRSHVGTQNTTTTGHSSTQPLAAGAGANTYDSTRSSNHGPHDSNIANKVDPRVDSDRDNRAAYGSHTTSTGTGANAYGSTRSSNYGPHDSNIANKVDPRVDSDRSNVGTYGTRSTNTGLATGTGSNAYESTRSSNYGPHDSNFANTMDPRVDSDRSNVGTYGSHHSTGLGTGAGPATGAATGAYGQQAYGSNRSSNHGPHDSNVANKLDPRVDSDRDNRAAYGSHQTSTGLGSNTNTAGTAGATGFTGHQGDLSSHAPTHSTATGPARSTAGPYESNLANKADPRVDSNLSNEKTGRFDKDVHKSSIGGAGVIPISGNAGPTSTKTFEEAQHSGATGAGSSYNTTGGGFENKRTAGPHKSDIANKLDPRVDSDLDGSKTLGSGTQRY